MLLTRRATVVPLLLVLTSCAECLPVDTDPLSHLPKGQEQLDVLCARGTQNAVTAAFCNGAPAIDSLDDLQELLDVHPTRTAAFRTGFSFTGHSTALFGRHVNAFNPRGVFVKVPAQRPQDDNFMTLGFSRGEQLVEIAVMAPGQEPVFYIVRYEQACNATEGGCDLATLLTERTESDWTGFSLYDDSDLHNTVFDCLHCHQPDGPEAPRFFRMQELQNPWTHWFAPFSDGRALMDDYRLIHGDSVFAGVTAGALAQSNPILVQNVVEEAGHKDLQPNLFPSPIVNQEVIDSATGQPFDNTVVGSSPTWQALFDEAFVGNAIPPPFHDQKITDPDKVVRAVNAALAFRDDPIKPFPDLRALARVEADRGRFVLAKPDASAPELFVQMCSQCHNSKLEQSLSRANFNAFTAATEGASLPGDQKANILDRLKRSKDDRYKMPPSFVRELSDDEIARIEAFLAP